MNGLGLTDTMRSVLCLFVHSRVPIRVIKDYTVCAGQVNTDAAASCARDEAKELRGQIEAVDHLLTSFYFD